VSAIVAAKRAALGREGVDSENWMWKAAVSVSDANKALRTLREARMDDREEETYVEGEDGRMIVDEGGEEEEGVRMRRRMERVLGVYEPHTDTIHCG
jgi:hypothetical protein